MRYASLLLSVFLVGCPSPDETGPDPVPSCVPATCAELGALCGPVGDRCGGLLACGSCPSGEVCGAAGPGRCGAPICTEAGFCWESPLPQGNTLETAIAFGSADAWVAGGAGTVLHWNGARWSATPTGTRANLRALWGASSADLWAAGSGTLLRWNGSAWASWPAPDAPGVVENFYGLDGSSADDVWLAGDAVFRWNGASWAQVPGATGVDGLSVAAPGDVWATRWNGDVVRWQGSGWTTVHSGPALLTSIWAASATDVWVGCASWLDGSGGLLHFDGDSWTKLTSLDGTSLEGTSPVVSGSGPDDVWVVTGGGLVFHRDASGWKRIASPTLRGLNAVAPTGDGGAVAAGSRGELVRATAGGIEPWSSAWVGFKPRLTATLSGEVVAASTGGGTALWDGTGWQALPAAVSGEVIDALWGASVNDLWAGGVHLWHRTTGDWFTGDWSQSIGPGFASPKSIWGGAPNDVWAVGGSSTIWHYDGRWSVTGGVGPSLTEVWGSGPLDVWAVGAGGTILRHQGGAFDAWEPVDSTTTSSLQTVWGSGPTDVWAGGAAGTLLHWNGSAWSAEASPTTDAITRIWGSGPTDVWILDDQGKLHHHDGGGWSTIDPGASATWTLQGDGASVLWIGGSEELLRLTR
jgi:hypothetical protein